MKKVNKDFKDWEDKDNSFIDFLQTDIKIVNKYFLALFILALLTLVGYTSYSLFTYEVTSLSNVKISYGGAAPITCTWSGANSVPTSSTVNFDLTCTSRIGITTQTLTSNKFTVTGGLTITSITSSPISNGYKYRIRISTPSIVSTASISLNANSVYNYSYDTNTITNKNISIIAFEKHTLAMAPGLGGEEGFYSYRMTTQSIRFETSFDYEPTSYDDSWDLSENGDNSIVGYAIENENSLYDIIIIGDGNIYAPEDSTLLFGGFYNLNSITNINYLNTSDVINMSSMFMGLGCYSTASEFALDLSDFDTSNVTNMSGMFGYAFNQTNAEYSVDTSCFDMTQVTDMSGMFYSFGYFNGGEINLSATSFNTGVNLTDAFSSSFITTIYVKTIQDKQKIDAQGFTNGFQDNITTVVLD